MFVQSLTNKSQKPGYFTYTYFSICISLEIENFKLCMVVGFWSLKTFNIKVQTV